MAVSATLPWEILSVSMSTGNLVEQVLPDKTRAIMITANGAVTMEDSGGTEFPIASGVYISVEDPNLANQTLGFNGSTGTTVYIFCVTGLAA